MRQKLSPIQPIRKTYRMLLGATVIIIAVALLAAILTIPFMFESQTMFYKFGWKKTLLRAGKMVGLTAAFLVFLQLALAGRLKWLDRIFSLPTLYTAHRYTAYAIIALALLHPVLVFIPDNMVMIPFEARYWPEWVGAGLLILIALQFAMSRWRTRVFRAYQKWLMAHRIVGIGAIVLLPIHVLYASDTFERDGLPRSLVILAVVLVLTLWLWVRLRGSVMREKSYSIGKIEPAGEDAYTVILKQNPGKPLGYLPGQFAFLDFNARRLSKEPHPFTICSSPLRPETLQFTIRSSGDWTRQIKELRVGEQAKIQGPFGFFSHLMIPHCREIIMIAGGIGITPMLSMLRYMADSGDSRPTILIWSNRTPDHLFNRSELDALTDQLTDFNWIPTFTREKGDIGYFGRLNRQLLKSLLQTNSRKAVVFLCGPPLMVQQVRKDLKQIGFRKRAIYFEHFGF